MTNLTYTQALSLLGKTRETRAWHQLRNPGAWHQLINLLFSLWKQARVRCRYSPERFPLVPVPERVMEPLFSSKVRQTFYSKELKMYYDNLKELWMPVISGLQSSFNVSRCYCVTLTEGKSTNQFILDIYYTLWRMKSWTADDKILALWWKSNNYLV